MKAIKKNFENLQAVARSITSVDFQTGRFFIKAQSSDLGFILLYSNRDSIGSSILRLIPCNYRYRVSFVDSMVCLRIWCF